MSEGDAKEPVRPSEGRPRPSRPVVTTGPQPAVPLLPTEADPLATSGIRPEAASKATVAERRMLARVGHYAHRGITLPVATWSLPFLAILGCAALIFLASFWLDLITAAIDDAAHLRLGRRCAPVLLGRVDPVCSVAAVGLSIGTSGSVSVRQVSHP